MAIGENSNDAFVEYVVQDRANLVEIELFAALILIKCIVKFELSILYLFCNILYWLRGCKPLVTYQKHANAIVTPTQVTIPILGIP